MDTPAATVGPTSAEMADFLVELGCALHAYGTPTPRIEEAITEVARAHGLRAQFLVTPTSVQASFGSGHEQVHYLERVDEIGRASCRERV